MAERTPPASNHDRVFNAETCRALRRVSRSRMAVGVFTLALLAPAAIVAISALFSPSPLLVQWLGIAYLGVVFGTSLWVTMPTREARREVKHAVVWFVAKIVGRDHKLPSEYQPEADGEDHAEPPAVPALAAGRAPLDWGILIGFPAAVALRLIVVDGVALGVALGGCIVLGAILVRFTRGGFMRSTYPPETETAENERVAGTGGGRDG